MKFLNSAICTYALLACLAFAGCQRTTQNESDRISQQMRSASESSVTEPLRQGLRNLSQTTQINKSDMIDETRVLINAWLKTADPKSVNYQPSKLLDGLDARDLARVGCESPESNQLGVADVESMFQAQLMRKLSNWIIALPVRDRVFQPMLTQKMSTLNPEQAVKLEQAYKLFDWTIRNIKLAPLESSQSSVKVRDPRMPMNENGVGYGFLPWEATLFSQADFIVRGRIFGALAAQQEIDTCWISVGSAPGAAGDLFAMGLLIQNQLLLLDSRLGLPILDPDTDAWATIQDVSKNDKILRRLNLPQYEYAFQQPAITSVQLLIDATPFTLSRRAKIVENSLIGDERMVLAMDADAFSERLGKAAPNSTISIWYTPLLAQIFSMEIQERLKELSQFTMRYMSEHLIWMTEGPVAQGRQMHLAGRFEPTMMEGLGALGTYNSTRVDDASLKRMAFNPDVQRGLGLERDPNETEKMYEARVAQAIAIFSRAKFDVAFLMGQLHYDRGDYKSSNYWLRERLLKDNRGARWFSPGWYTLARAHIELGEFAEAEEALTKPTLDQNSNQPAYVINPQDAGNRIRLRYLRRLSTPKEETPKDESAPKENAAEPTKAETEKPEASPEPNKTDAAPEPVK